MSTFSRTPIRNGSVAIHVRKVNSSTWVATISAAKIRSSSVCCAASAAICAAYRYFWGGVTRTFVGPAEREITKVAGRDEIQQEFMAWLDTGEDRDAGTWSPESAIRNPQSAI